MTDGGIGNGLAYWATINITGDLDKAELNTVIGKIKDLLKGQVGGKSIRGELVDAARISNAAKPQVSVGFQKAPHKSAKAPKKSGK
jgi:hypothetical protein